MGESYNEAEWLVDVITEADRKGKGAEIAELYRNSAVKAVSVVLHAASIALKYCASWQVCTLQVLLLSTVHHRQVCTLGVLLLSTEQHRLYALRTTQACSRVVLYPALQPRHGLSGVRCKL
jgi:hypothetical protein